MKMEEELKEKLDKFKGDNELGLSNNQINIKKTYTHFVLGHFLPFTHNGWNFYPITYNGKKYVINIKYHVDMFEKEICLQSTYKLYEYEEKKRFLKNHKGKRCGYGKVPFIKINDDIIKSGCCNLALNKIADTIFLDINELGNDRELKKNIVLYAKEIITSILEDYADKQLKEIEKTKALEKARNWDGKIE